MTNEEVHLPRVSVTFTKSSTKDGGEGYTIRCDEGVDETEAQRVFDVASALRVQAGDPNDE